MTTMIFGDWEGRTDLFSTVPRVEHCSIYGVKLTGRIGTALVTIPLLHRWRQHSLAGCMRIAMAMECTHIFPLVSELRGSCVYENLIPTSSCAFDGDHLLWFMTRLNECLWLKLLVRHTECVCGLLIAPSLSI